MDNKLDKLSDDAFINIIANNKNSSKGIAKIDSLLDNNIFSNHKLALLYYNKAAYLLYSREYISSIAHLNKSLSIFKDENNKKFIGKTYNVLASANINLNREKTALKQINLALSFFKKIDNKYEEAVTLDALARINYRNGDYKKSLAILKKSLKLYIEIDDTKKIFATYGNIGSIYRKIKDYKNAVYYYKIAIKFNEEYDFLNSNPLQDLGLIYLETGAPEKCIDLHIKSIQIQNKTGHLAIQKQIYDVLIDSIKGKQLKPSVVIGTYFNNLPNYILKRDSVIKLIEKSKVESRIKLIEEQYKLQIKKNELNQELELNRRNKLFFVIIIGLLLFIGLFLLQRNRNKQLQLNHEKLMLEQKVLRTQMNPHFIFNALTSIQKTIFDNDPLKSATYLSKFAKLIRQNFEFVSKKEILLSDDLDALKNYIDTQLLRFDNKFSYQIIIADTINPSQVYIPPMLLQPFIENAIEHGLKPKTNKGLLGIEISKKGNLYQFVITDNGIGYNKDKENQKREHSLDVFLKRLKLRNLDEEKYFSIEAQKDNKGTIVSFCLKLKSW